MKKIKNYSIIYIEKKKDMNLMPQKGKVIIMDEEIIFEDYNIKVTEEELKQIDKKTLKKCKKVLQETLAKLGN